MAKLTKKEIVRRYAEKNPMIPVRQMASDLDMAPSNVHAIMWALRKEGKAPPSKNPRSRQTNKTIVDVINSWEGKVTPSNPVNAKSNLIDRILKTDAERTGFAPAPVKNEPGKLEFQEAINKRRIELLEEQVHNQTIIKYLEKRIEELNVRR